jgi:hypothetical protein
MKTKKTMRALATIAAGLMMTFSTALPFITVMKNFTSIAVMLLITASLMAQVPQAFKYQAVARDNAGNILANQNVSFRMTIIQGLLPGQQIYSEVHYTNTNEFGLATLEIGRGEAQSQDEFGDIDWSVTPVFIKTELDPSGGNEFIELGTSELLSVPFALYSYSNATSFWNKSGDNLFYNNGKIGIGTSSPSYRLTIKSLGYADGISLLANDNDVIFFARQMSTGAGGIYCYNENQENTILFNGGGNSWFKQGRLGIGTDNPDVALKVTSTIQFDPGDVGDDRKGTALLSSSGGNQGLGQFGPSLSFSGINTARRRAAIAAIQSTSNSNQIGLAFFTHPGTTTANDIVSQMMVIEHGGNVGIGEDDPEVALAVKTTSQFDPGDYTDNRKGNILLSLSEGIQGVNQYGPSLAFGGINTHRRRAAIAAIQSTSDPNQVGLAFFTHPGTTTANDIVSQMMVIEHGGNVGIGEDDPEVALAVKTTSQFDPGDYTDNRKGNILLSLSEGIQGVNQYGPSLAFGGINTHRRRAAIAAIQSSEDPDHVGLAFFTHPGSATANDIVSQMMVITHGGNVGIGTTNPTHLLSVNGIIRSKEIIVNTGWSDFVFEEAYQLMPLPLLENYIKINKHLPEIPSANEVEENGISLGEMDAKLLQKIEELTLYIIELQKQITDLKMNR